MAKENRFGKIFLCIRVIGFKIGLMEEADSFMPMEMFTKDNGKMIKLTAKEFMLKMTAQVTQDNGYKIFSMVSGYRNGLMIHHTKGNNSLN